MRVLLEVPLSISGAHISHFSWLKGENNLLFTLEGGKKMRTISTIYNPGKELQSATLVESRVCTSLCWNKDGSLLALVVDKRQVYFWEVKTNNFTHFKPKHSRANNAGATNSTRKIERSMDMEQIAWSKVTNKYVICYSSGQLLLCHCLPAGISENLVDNSDGALKHVTFVHCSEHLDIFVCITVISEILVMNFDGETLFYIQNDLDRVTGANLSPLGSKVSRDMLNDPEADENNFVWLSYWTHDGAILFKRVYLHSRIDDGAHQSDRQFERPNKRSELSELYWLNGGQALACYASGEIVLLHLECISLGREDSDYSSQASIILDISESLNQPMTNSYMSSDEKRQIDSKSENAEKFIVQYRFSVNRSSEYQEFRSYSMVAISNFQVFYYEMLEDGYDNSSPTFEQVDYLDLMSSLQKVNLNLIKVEWSNDCSMLAVQLSNGLILVYRTRLPDLKVAMHGPRAAYLSEANEVTLLNYEPEKESSDVGSTAAESVTSGENMDNALVVKVDMKPALIAVGPRHLVLALNNRARFYHIESDARRSPDPESRFRYVESEFASVVVGLSLCSNFVAILFDDGRLKLQPIPVVRPESRQRASNLDSNSSDYEDEGLGDERFFPDPTQPARISDFVLTEDLLVYCSHDFKLNIFSLSKWLLVQVYDHSRQFQMPIERIKCNCHGNKFICLTRAIRPRIGASSNAHLYDLYSNKMIEFAVTDARANLVDTNVAAGEENLFRLNRLTYLHQRQLITCALPSKLASTLLGSLDVKRLSNSSDKAGLRGQILDAIWDTDGRTAFLIERKWMHIVVIVEHTLGQEEPIVEYVAGASKGSTYTTLYASQGIVSFQTSLGRVINCVLQSYDDELKLANLERKISEVKRATENDETDKLTPMARMVEVTKLKLDYLEGILPIHSLTKCKEICEHLAGDEQFNLLPPDQLSDQQLRFICEKMRQLIWMRLADRALYTLNLDFALLIYRKHGPTLLARAIGEILGDARTHEHTCDLKATVKRRLLSMS